ncbi:anks1b [Symbiodinium necroappetens]|uniref:Anks1b protein n=1 Tax=Symbiodinium necroappetens TaxID=1628268 RepID=A0A813BQX9_9DINO|nr:anks1b [Symbiodinium necroappetens]
MSRWSALALSTWLCLVLSQTVMGDLNTQVHRNLRHGNHSALSPNRSSSQEGSGGLKVAPRANETGRQTPRSPRNQNSIKFWRLRLRCCSRMSQARTPPTVRKPGQVRAMRLPSARHSSPQLVGSAAGTTAATAAIIPSSTASATKAAFGSGTAAMTMAGSAGMHRTAVVAGVGVDVILHPRRKHQTAAVGEGAQPKARL